MNILLGAEYAEAKLLLVSRQRWHNNEKRWSDATVCVCAGVMQCCNSLDEDASLGTLALAVVLVDSS
jgi:hypothetical protein